MESNIITLKKTINANLFEGFINYIDASAKTIDTYRKSIKQFVKYLAEKEITTQNTSLQYLQIIIISKWGFQQSPYLKDL